MVKMEKNAVWNPEAREAEPTADHFGADVRPEPTFGRSRESEATGFALRSGTLPPGMKRKNGKERKNV